MAKRVCGNPAHTEPQSPAPWSRRKPYLCLACCRALVERDGEVKRDNSGRVLNTPIFVTK